MRASLPELIQALHAQEPPRRIWQQPYDPDPSHYKRLCRANGAAPSNRDLIEYTQDMLYGRSPLQPDLLRYLLPICLNAWQQDLLADHHSEYEGFIEHFWAALANKPLLQDNLTADEYDAVETFMAASLLDRIDQENRLTFAGMGASAYTWFNALSSLCVVFPTLPALWTTWWEMNTPGQAYAVLQYISCLLYEDDQNPVFAPWTPHGGGGPPVLWEPEGHIYEHGWRAENAAFVQVTLTPDYVEDRLQSAAQTIKDGIDGSVAQQMVDGFDAQKPLLEYRLAELPLLLLASEMESRDWSHYD